MDLMVDKIGEKALPPCVIRNYLSLPPLMPSMSNCFIHFGLNFYTVFRLEEFEKYKQSGKKKIIRRLKKIFKKTFSSFGVFFVGY